MFGFSKKVTPSSLSSSIYVKGFVKSEAELYVDGTIEGDVSCKTLIVGINGKIKSSVIQVEKIIVHGSIDGNINAMSVYLGASARINGNIMHNDISIESGAFVNGDLKQKRD